MSLFVLSQAILVAALHSAQIDTAAGTAPGVRASAQRGQVASSEAPENSWQLQGGLDLRYDDNILFLSAGAIRRFESGSTTQLYRIHSIDDLVYSPWAEVRAPLGRSSLGIGARLNSYSDNPVKDYELLNLFIDHTYDKRKALRFTYRWLHDGYAGELTDPDTGQPGSVFYDAHDLEARYRYRCSRVVTIEPRQAVRMRLYGGSFDDARTRAGVDTKFLTYVRAARWLRFDLDVDLEYLKALSPRDDFDPTALRYYFEAAALVEPRGSGLELTPSARYGQRRYTTSKSGDSTYRGRTDSLYQLEIDVRYNLSADLSAHVTLERAGVAAGVSNALDEDTSFERNVGSAGLSYRF